ncbi:unnamed protein product [Urochloa decumbens]|uniref:F-box domain-containing protein n=1 Tax=Urochloa decumbens TaxID=240449 RepID=A0ABC9GDV1_9POAL
MPAPELMEEIVEEVLLRFPPRDPTCLARAALVCKRWRRLISDPGFRRRFDEFHPTPKMLGLLCNIYSAYHSKLVARFVSTSSSCSPLADDGHSWRAEDARHGRVLLSCDTTEHVLFMVWDPITGHQQELPAMPRTMFRWRSALIFCAAVGTCSHLDCRRGPFRVVYMGCGRGGAFTCTYSSEAAAWSEPVSASLPINSGMAQSVLVGKTLYFKFDRDTLVKKYDCELCKVVSSIPLPLRSIGRSAALITTEDGGLGCAALLKYKFHVWSRKADYEVDNGWLKSRVIDLERMLNIVTGLATPMDVVGFADGIGTIFFNMDSVIFTIYLKTNKVKEVYNDSAVCSVIPYMGFCSPENPFL